MKKLTGWLIIILCSVFLLLFVAVLIEIIPEMMDKMTTKDVISAVVGFIVIIILLVVGLMNGLKRIRKDKIARIVNYTDTLDINLTGRIAYIDYRNLILGLSYKKPVSIVLICLVVLASLSLFVYDSETDQIYLYIFICLFLGFLFSPIITLKQIKKTYQTNKIFQEQLSYRLTNDSIYVKGETVDSTQKWTGFYKIKETKNFFMFYQGEGVATLLSKKMFTDNELNDFRRFICSLNLKSV